MDGVKLLITLSTVGISCLVLGMIGFFRENSLAFQRFLVKIQNFIHLD